MRPSEFEAIRPHLQETIDDINYDSNRRQSLVNDEERHKLFNELAAEPEDKPSKTKLQKLPSKRKKQYLRNMLGPPPKEKRAMQAYRVREKLLERSPPITRPNITCLYPWATSAREAAVLLQKVGYTTEASAINEVLTGLPTGLVDGRKPDNMTRQLEAIQAGAERIKIILENCLKTEKCVVKDDSDADSADIKKVFPLRMPDDPDILALGIEIHDEQAKPKKERRSKNEIARGYEGKTNRKADNLLRTLRRFQTGK
ncbi:MAG: hypothetical protein PVH19_11970 [Planctomycetia bacterium]|jgi:hypothetical protein